MGEGRCTAGCTHFPLCSAPPHRADLPRWRTSWGPRRRGNSAAQGWPRAAHRRETHYGNLPRARARRQEHDVHAYPRSAKPHPCQTGGGRRWMGREGGRGETCSGPALPTAKQANLRVAPSGSAQQRVSGPKTWLLCSRGAGSKGGGEGRARSTEEVDKEGEREKRGEGERGDEYNSVALGISNIPLVPPVLPPFFGPVPLPLSPHAREPPEDCVEGGVVAAQVTDEVARL